VKGKIFISYRRASNQWAIERLYEVLADKFGADDVFFDRVAIEPGADWLASLDREIAQASAVILVYSKEWAGTKDDGSRRIDQPDDMVRRELITANRFGRPIFPLIIDDSAPPNSGQLPEGLRFVLKRQFLKLVPATAEFSAQAQQLTQAIAGAQPGPAWGRRFFWQVTWIALGVSSFVAAWHAMGGSSTYDNAFARGAITARVSLGIEDGALALGSEADAGPPGAGAGAGAGNGSSHGSNQGTGLRAELSDQVALVEINDLDFQAVLGGTRRYDPLLTSILLGALTTASQDGQACRADAPVALNLDLAPDPDRYDKAAFEALEVAITRLAECRPTVLACPRSVVLNLSPAEDMKWMGRLLARAPDRLLFTHAALDPRGLRHSENRSEPGVLLADLATNGKATLQRQRALQQAGCVCPLTPEALASCRQTDAGVAWDPKGLAVPFGGRSMPLAHALPNLKALASRRFVLVGEAHGTRSRYAVPGRDDGISEVASDTAMQSFLLNGALQHASIKGQPWMVLLSALFSWCVAAAVLSLGCTLGRYDARFSKRVPTYLATAAIMFGVPLLTLVVAARFPSLIWLAALFALVGVLTVGRALLACFEVVLFGGVRWKSMQEHINDIRFDLDTRSAVMALAGTVGERLFMLTCVIVTVWVSWHAGAG
jgi:TIR domain